MATETTVVRRGRSSVAPAAQRSPRDTSRLAGIARRLVRLAAYGWLLTTILLASTGVIPWHR